VKDNFVRYPHTPHLAWLGIERPRDDKVFSEIEVQEFLSKPIIVEEKVDGANIGISFDSQGTLLVQNRGTYLTAPYSGQFTGLNEWLHPIADALFDSLTDRLILFGEWCVARHSILYSKLPDWFIGFDAFDRTSEEFLSTKRRNALLLQLNLPAVPEVARGNFSLFELTTLLTSTTSAFRTGPPEGFYLRQEDDRRTTSRAKLVRREFTQAIGSHWRRRIIERNKRLF
jgi:ATP-dependent RNA circularization protein (DNA/RNA ligase family)